MPSNQNQQFASGDSRRSELWSECVRLKSTECPGFSIDRNLHNGWGQGPVLRFYPLDGTDVLCTCVMNQWKLYIIFLKPTLIFKLFPHDKLVLQVAVEPKRVVRVQESSLGTNIANPINHTVLTWFYPNEKRTLYNVNIYRFTGLMIFWSCRICLAYIVLRVASERSNFWKLIRFT